MKHSSKSTVRELYESLMNTDPIILSQMLHQTDNIIDSSSKSHSTKDIANKINADNTAVIFDSSTIGLSNQLKDSIDDLFINSSASSTQQQTGLVEPCNSSSAKGRNFDDKNSEKLSDKKNNDAATSLFRQLSGQDFENSGIGDSDFDVERERGRGRGGGGGGGLGLGEDSYFGVQDQNFTGAESENFKGAENQDFGRGQNYFGKRRGEDEVMEENNGQTNDEDDEGEVTDELVTVPNSK